MRRDVAVEASGPVEAAAVGPALAHVGDGPAETPASAEAPVIDEFEVALTAAFGPVDRWFHQPDGLRLPLP